MAILSAVAYPVASLRPRFRPPDSTSGSRGADFHSLHGTTGILHFRRSSSCRKCALLKKNFAGAGLVVAVGSFPVVCYSGNAAAAGGAAAVPVPEPNKRGPAWNDVMGRLQGSQAPATLSDIVWPSVGGFVAMAFMGLLDVLLAPRGLSFTLGSFGSVCTLLFAAPKLPSSQKYSVYVSHLGCAAVGVLALAIFGPGWVARAVALAAAIAFMQYTGSLHPPAAGLPLIMIDAQKLHHLRWWYVVYPGVIGCVFLFLLQEAVTFLQEKWRF